MGGCAQIDAFEVRPLRACAGDTVTVSWRAEGDVSLAAEPPIADLDLDGKRLPTTGSKSVHVVRSTRLTLTASRTFKDAHVEADVVVVPGAPAKPFGGLAACNDTTHAVEVSFALDAHQVSASTHVAQLDNANDRALTVTHDGPEETMAAHGTSVAFRDRPAAGTWRLRAPLGAGETCDQALRALSDRLTAIFKFDCGGP